MAGPPVYHDGYAYFATYIRHKSVFRVNLTNPGLEMYAESVFAPNN
jgi:hypothetical protein